MNKLFLIILIQLINACTSLDSFAIDRTNIFDRELKARDGLPGRRIGGGTR